MFIKRAAAAAAAVLLTASLGACTQGSTSNPQGPGGTVTLKFQSLSDQPGAIAATKEIVDAWNAANPDTQVEIVQAGWDGIYDKLITQFNGKSAPDIVHYEAASIVPFAEDDYLADLGPKIDPAVKSDISEGIWKSVTVNGKIVGVPTELQSYLVFANKKLLEDAGVTVPTGDSMTWEQFRDIAKKTTKSGQYGVAWGLKSPTATMLSLGLTNNGGYFTGAGKEAQITVGEGEMALPKLIRAMSTQDKSIDPVSLTQTGSQALASFYGEKAAMTVQGSFQAANMAKDAGKVEWVALPPLSGANGIAQAANPQTLSVSADSPNVDKAIAFVNFFAKAENLAKINTADSLIPPSNAAQESILKATGGKNGWDMTMKSAKGLTAAPFMTVSAYSAWKDTIATPAFQKYLAGQIDDAGLAKELTDGFAQVNK